MVRRYRCRSCQHYQTELPDCVVPYKHYETEVICGVLDDIVTSDDIDSEQYPSELTMQRWRDWATQKEKEIERVLQTDTSGISPCRGADEKEKSQLRKLKTQTEAWLETFIRIFCNIN